MKQITHVKLVSLVDWIIDHATSSSQLILTKASEWGPMCVFFVGERVFRAEIMADEVFWMIRWWRVLVTKRACRLLFVSSITGTGATLTKYKIQNVQYYLFWLQLRLYFWIWFIFMDEHFRVNRLLQNTKYKTRSAIDFDSSTNQCLHLCSNC